jgi:hypothetical protein
VKLPFLPLSVSVLSGAADKQLRLFRKIDANHGIEIVFRELKKADGDTVSQGKELHVG